MFTLWRQSGTRGAVTQEAASLVLAGVTAEFFYKFHSFTLECAAFLATWFVFGAVAAGVGWLWRKSPSRVLPRVPS
jgi:hypothetical protein